MESPNAPREGNSDTAMTRPRSTIDQQLDHLGELLDELFLMMPALMRSGCDETALTPHQGILLRALEARGALAMGELRTHFPGAQSSMSELIGRLAKLGFVHKKPLAADRRTVTVAITERGRAMLAQQRKVMRERHRNVLEKLSALDQGQIVRSFETIVELFGRAAAASVTEVEKQG